MTGTAGRLYAQLDALEEDYGSRPWRDLERAYRPVLAEALRAVRAEPSDAELRCVLGFALTGYVDLVGKADATAPGIGPAEVIDLAKGGLTELAWAVHMGVDLDDPDVEPGLTGAFCITLLMVDGADRYAPEGARALSAADRVLARRLMSLPLEDDSAVPRCRVLAEAGGFAYRVPLAFAPEREG
jgi:hypothetical protein